MKQVRIVRLLAVLSVLLVPVFSALTNAADETPAAKPASEAPPAAGADEQGDIVAEWKKLDARRIAIAGKLAALQKEFQTAETARKREIRSEFQQLLFEFRSEVQPRMQEIAEDVYAKDPQQSYAAELVMLTAWERGDYETARKLATERLKADPQSTRALNIAGVANYALHNFETAAEQLAAAEKAEALDASSGARFQPAVGDYIDFWKQEQEIRAAEAKAVGTPQQLPRVVLKTTKGEVELELFENEAPNTVANFISLVDGKKYDGIAFHRVIPNFMIQGGDPNTLDEDPSNDGQGGPGHTIACECYAENARKHFRGSLSMAHAGKDTGGSQFFITHLPTHWLNPNAEAQRGHTVFGRVVRGLDVVDSIEAGDRIETAVVTVRRDHPYEPKTTPDPTAPPAEGDKKDE